MGRHDEEHRDKDRKKHHRKRSHGASSKDDKSDEDDSNSQEHRERKRHSKKHRRSEEYSSDEQEDKERKQRHQKHHKKKKKQHKHHRSRDDDREDRRSSSSHKKDKKKKEKSAKAKLTQPKPSLISLGPPLGKAPDRLLDADKDYFAFHEHLWVFLYRERGQAFNDMTSEETRQVFREFVKRYNAGDLPQGYYVEKLSAAVLEESKTTQHSWSFRMSESEGRSLQSIEAGVRKQTEYKDPSAAAAARPQSLPKPSQGNRNLLTVTGQRRGGGGNRNTGWMSWWVRLIVIFTILSPSWIVTARKPFTLGIRDSFMIAHSFHQHPSFGPAGGLHGATYTCDVEFATQDLVDGTNWVIDIGLASEILAKVLAKYNYQNLDKVFPNGEMTTTEFMCRQIFHDLCECLKQENCGFAGEICVKLWESHKAWASYTGSIE